MKKRLAAVILTVLFAAGLITAFFFRDTVLLYVAPKAVLSYSLTRLYRQLEDRFADSPMTVIARSVDIQGRYNTRIQADTAHTLLGELHYDMDIQTDAASHCLYAQGTAGTLDNTLNLSLYMDRGYLAVSSRELVKGDWYGITYDSFLSDIRRIPLLSYVLSDKVVQEWNASLLALQAMMCKDYTLPDISEEQMHQLLAGILLLPGKVSQDQVESENRIVPCHRIDYIVKNEQITGLLPGENSSLLVSFYLYEKSVIQIDIDYSAETEQVRGEVYFGTNPESDELSLILKHEKGEQFFSLQAVTTTEPKEGTCTEKWYLQKNGIQTNLIYTWDSDSGDFLLSINESGPIEGNFAEAGNGFQVYTEDCDVLLNALRIARVEHVPKRCTITLQKGSDISVPQYKNLDQWSLDDFWKLVRGVGTLFGLNPD